MIAYLKKIKRVNSEARVLGLDLERKYVGVAISVLINPFSLLANTFQGL
jgi:repressor of nif and glnA expression